MTDRPKRTRRPAAATSLAEAYNACRPETAADKVAAMKDLLAWLRPRGYAVHQISIGDLSLAVTDVGPQPDADDDEEQPVNRDKPRDSRLRAEYGDYADESDDK